MGLEVVTGAKLSDLFDLVLKFCNVLRYWSLRATCWRLTRTCWGPLFVIGSWVCLLRDRCGTLGALKVWYVESELLLDFTFGLFAIFFVPALPRSAL